MLPPGGLAEGLPLLAAAGVRWIEIHGYLKEEFDYGDRGLIGATKRLIAGQGLAIWSCHSPAFEPINVASPDAELRARSCALMEEAMEASAEMGARVFVCDAVRSFRDADMREAGRPLYAASLHRLQRRASQIGVRLVIENHTRRWGPFTTPEDFLSLIADFDLAGLGACWDTGHAWIAGQPPETACRLGAHLVSLHVHQNDGTRDQHALPAPGTLPWQPLVEGLSQIRYRGPFMMELLPPDPPTVDAIRRLAADAVEVHRRFMG